MSYNKFLNKVLNKENINNYIFQINSKTGLIKENENIQINQFINEDIKIENTNLIFSKLLSLNNENSELNTLKKVYLKNDKFINISSKFKISKQQNDIKLEITDSQINPIININSNNVNVQSNYSKIKNLYGNIQYSDKEKLVQYIQPGSSGTFSINKNTQSGFDMFKKNANLDILTYVTCNPDDGFSNYPKDDIIANTNITNNYNYVNKDGIYTNTLYLKPGNIESTKKKYLSGNEHIFIIDVSKSVLPGWGFESTHPLNRISQYSAIKNSTNNNEIKKKEYQSIAIDLSSLVNNNNISPGYKFTFYFNDYFSNIQEERSVILHNNNYNNLDLNNSNWIDNTFDSRFCNPSKEDCDSDLELKNIFKNENYNHFDIENNVYNHTLSSNLTLNDIAAISNTQTGSPIVIDNTNYLTYELDKTLEGRMKSIFYNLPYYEHSPRLNDNTAKFFTNAGKNTSGFTILKESKIGLGKTNTIINYIYKGSDSNNNLNIYPSLLPLVGATYFYHRYIRSIGNVSDNKFVINYTKPRFLLNLGENSIILNDQNKLLKKCDVNILTNNNPYWIDSVLLSNLYKFNTPLDEANIINKNYFISNFSNSIKEFENNHLNYNNENIAKNESNFYINKPSATHVDVLSNIEYIKSNNNLKWNLTITLNKEFIKYMLLIQKRFLLLNLIYQKSVIHAFGAYILNMYKNTATNQVIVKLVKNKYVINIPFINLLSDQQSISKISNWYYCLDAKRTYENTLSSNASPQYELSTKLKVEEDKYSNSTIWTPYVSQNEYNMTVADINSNGKPLDLNENFEQITLMYIGFNSTLNRHEWCYV